MLVWCSNCRHDDHYYYTTTLLRLLWLRWPITTAAAEACTGGAVYGPYGGAGRYASYIQHGYYSRGAAVYGPSGAAGYRTAFTIIHRERRLQRERQRLQFMGRSVLQMVMTGPLVIIRSRRIVEHPGLEAAGAIHYENRYGNGTTLARNQEGDIMRQGWKCYKKTDDGWQQQTGNSPTRHRYKVGQTPANRHPFNRLPRANYTADYCRQPTQPTTTARQLPQQQQIDSCHSRRELAKRSAPGSRRYKYYAGATVSTNGGQVAPDRRYATSKDGDNEASQRIKLNAFTTALWLQTKLNRRG